MMELIINSTGLILICSVNSTPTLLQMTTLRNTTTLHLLQNNKASLSCASTVSRLSLGTIKRRIQTRQKRFTSHQVSSTWTTKIYLKSTLTCSRAKSIFSLGTGPQINSTKKYKNNPFSKSKIKIQTNLKGLGIMRSSNISEK